MSHLNEQISFTQHAFLVAWGQFAQEIGLIKALEAVPLCQKKYQHRPQTKALEFFVAHLAGCKHLRDISLAAHPLDKDTAVARAWGQTEWSDYSGVSRTLSSLSWTEVAAIVQAMQAVFQPLLDGELQQAQIQGKRLWYDGDLSGLPVSDSSLTFPNVAFGHMAAAVRLGYQAAVVSVQGSHNRRLWLSVAHHPGDTVSSTQALAMVQAAEARTGLRPQRRTALLAQRIAALQRQHEVTDQRRQTQQQAWQTAVERYLTLRLKIEQQEAALGALEQAYQGKQRPERPHSQLATARHQLQSWQDQLQRRQGQQEAAAKRLAKTEVLCQEQQRELARLQQRWQQFEQENATNTQPIQAVFRFDAGFGSYENITQLIELGYELYTKPYSHKVTKHLQTCLTSQTEWKRVGRNAEMVAWKDCYLPGCPYLLDVAVERFHTGKTIKHSALLHFGDDPVTQDLPAWFDIYNGRQTIEAGIKEGKQVFHLHRLKVRSEPAIYLQEQFVIMAANFIRWATQWLAATACSVENTLKVATMGVKKQVQVAAHVSAEVCWDSDGWLLRFSPYSAFAGKVLKLPGGISEPPLVIQKSVDFEPFFTESHLIAQPLR